VGSRRAVANGRRRPWRPRALAGIGESATRQALAHAAADPHPNLAVTIDFARWERLGRGMGEKIKGPSKVQAFRPPRPAKRLPSESPNPPAPSPREAGRGLGRGVAAGVVQNIGDEDRTSVTRVVLGDAQSALCEGLWHARKWARPLRG